MVLVDTSVWIDHLHGGDSGLAQLLGNGSVLSHPWVTGELALGNLRDRHEVIGLLHGLPQAIVADDAEVLRLIEAEGLYGTGIGYVDSQLLASARLTHGATLWTKDKRLMIAARRLGLESGPQGRSRP